MILRNQMPYYTISLHLFLNFGYTPEHHCHGNQNDNRCDDEYPKESTPSTWNTVSFWNISDSVSNAMR